MLFDQKETIGYKGKIYDKFKIKIKLYNPGRCGGTLIRQVLDCIFFPDVGMKHTHNIVELHDHFLVIPYRDFRDKLASHWRTLQYNRNVDWSSESFMKSQIDKTIEDIMGLERNRELYQYDKKVLWLRYESFFQNYKWLFKELEWFFKIKIPLDMKKYAVQETNLEVNIKRTEELMKENPSFDFDHDNEFGLHPAHIDSGKPGGWKRIIPKQFHQLVQDELGDYLKEWDY